MAISGKPFLVPCSRGLRKLVRRPDCHRCDQPSSLYWKVYSAISKIVCRIFVACLCQKLAACCWGLLMDCSSHPQRIPLCRYYTLFQIREVMAKWEQPIGCTTEGVPYRGTTTVLYLLHAADTQYIVVEHFPVLFSYLYGAKNCLYAITIFLFWPDIHTYC